MSILPHPGDPETKLAAADAYIARGWPVFVLGWKKTPVKNCARCDSQAATYVPHRYEDCGCLMCHGFYAATLELRYVREMLRLRPDGALAVRTGSPSGLLVIDAEASADERAGDGLTGLDVLDDWDGWTGFSLEPTLRQRTASGGLHLMYRLSEDVRVGSHNRVLPQVDIKAESGYVAVPFSGSGRSWLTDQSTEPANVPPRMLEWLEERRGGVGGVRRSGWRGGVGQLLDRKTYERAKREGAKSGEREPFFAMLSFELFKAGHERYVVEQTMREHWERCEQPPGDEFPWQAIEYKLNRDARGVHADPAVSDSLRRWAAGVAHADKREESREDRDETTGYRRVGRVTLTRRRPR